MAELELLTRHTDEVLRGLRHASYLLVHRLTRQGHGELAKEVNRQLGQDAALAPRYNRTLPSAGECCDLLLLRPALSQQVTAALHPENQHHLVGPYGDNAAHLRRAVSRWLERVKCGRENYASDPEYWDELLAHLGVLGKVGDRSKTKLNKSDPLTDQLRGSFMFAGTWHGASYWLNAARALEVGEQRGLIFNTRANA